MSRENIVDLSGEVPEGVEQLVRFVLHEKGVSCAEVSVAFVTEEEMTRLNREYRGMDGPTDVLSFSLQEDLMKQGDFDTPVPLGDVVLSEPVIRQNCRRYRVPFFEELTRLVIHGMLHLLGETHEGYDHTDPMLAEQERLVKKYLEAKEQEIT